MIKNISLLIIGSAFGLILLEIILISFFKVSDKGYGATYLTESDIYLGYKLIPKSNWRSIKYKSDGSICYDVWYSINENGNRDSVNKNLPKCSSLFIDLYGDSLVFGEGINSTETLSHVLSEHYSIVNHGVFGYGPQHLLIQVQNYGEVKENNPNRIGLYLLIPDHLERAAGGPGAVWLYNGPYFDLVDGNLELIGSFQSERKFISFLFTIWSNLSQQYNVISKINLSKIFYSDEYLVSLSCELLSAASLVYENKSKGEFYVIFHPQWFNSSVSGVKKSIIECLKNKKIKIIDLSNYEFTKESMINDGCDGHHNYKFNLWLSSEILKFLSQTDSKIHKCS